MRKQAIIFTFTCLTQTYGSYYNGQSKEHKGTKTLRNNALQSMYRLVHAVNTEEEQKLKKA